MKSLYFFILVLFSAQAHSAFAHDGGRTWVCTDESGNKIELETWINLYHDWLLGVSLTHSGSKDLNLLINFWADNRPQIMGSNISFYDKSMNYFKINSVNQDFQIEIKNFSESILLNLSGKKGWLTVRRHKAIEHFPSLTCLEK